MREDLLCEPVVHDTAATGFPKLSCAVLMNSVKLSLNEHRIRFHC